MTVIYIARPHTFFDEGTEVKKVGESSPHSLFAYFKGIHYGEEKIELCRFDEFEQIWENDDDDSNDS
jgi:hypothetical protein